MARTFMTWVVAVLGLLQPASAQAMLLERVGNDLFATGAVVGSDFLASGYCISACSLMFIAGKERFFASGNKPRNTMIGIHGAHDAATKQVNPVLMPQMYALYKSQMGDKFDADAMNQALYLCDHARDIKGVRRVDSAELVALLKSQAPPKLIDVMATVPAMLPSALHFMSGGFAFTDEKADAAFDQRFRDMLNLAVIH